ncbi:MAG TPA: two-component regulator propeller domain-containing protein, partial [Pseudodesulfovibrio sp.]|nr:two-component regulator propeller domain-containing protein [Pseudodesulfovibrio sp.]
MPHRPLRLWLALALCTLPWCADARDGAATGPAAQPAGGGYHTEVFGVGKGVFVRSLNVDKKHNALWVATSVGVEEVDLNTRRVLHTFTRADGLANEYVFTTYTDREGYQWFGTNGGGATSYRDGHWRTYFPMHGLADYWVYNFDEQADGTLWIGTWHGVTRLDRNSGKMTNYIDQLINKWVYAVKVDSRDRVWFGTEGGITMYDGRRWRSWNHKDGLGAANKRGLPPSKNTGLGAKDRHDLSVMRQGKPTYNPNYVFSLYITADDQVWAGTWGGGVSHFDGQRWSNYTEDDGLAGNIVYAVIRDANGVFWFGTDKGLSRFDGRHWKTFDE